MKFNSFFLILIPFFSFSLFSMDAQAVVARKAISLPNSPYFKPQKSSTEPRNFSLDEDVFSQLAWCNVCEKNYPTFFLLEHIKACRAAALKEAQRLGNIHARKNLLTPKSEQISLVQITMDLD